MNLRVVGHTDLGGQHRYGAAAAVGNTVIVAANPLLAGAGAGGYESSTVEIVSLDKPATPRLVAAIPVEPGAVVVDVDAQDVSTPSFSGALAAVGIDSPTVGPGGCGDHAPAGVRYYSLRDPAAPLLVGRALPCGGCRGPQSVSLAPRADGRVLSVSLSALPDPNGGGTHNVVDIVDVTDPSRPEALSRWAPPEVLGPPTRDCFVASAAGTVVLHDVGQRALVALGDGDITDLDLSDPAAPTVAVELPQASGNTGARRAVSAVPVPVGNRTLAIVSEEDHGVGACAGSGSGGGLRLIALDPPPPREVDGTHYPSAASPGRLVASGELAFVTWHADGLRVVDLGQLGPRTVAQFAPQDADVTAVALLPENVVVIDQSSGLYALVRPAEGHPTSFWRKLKDASGPMSFFGVLCLVTVVPRVSTALSASRARRSRPAPARVPPVGSG